MMSRSKKTSGAELFARGESTSLETYEKLVAAMKPVGPIKIEVKKTCVHLCGANSAFAGVHPRKAGVLLTIRSAKPIRSRRIRKSEAVSANRAHNDMLLGGPEEVDDEVLDWLVEGLALSGGPAR